mmetsp:Transcript_50621/g.56557  ORF Transcript_50621/g.56557 Transcript_50621/m.56557 type:complete len:225 (-) Transcript_50621:14-688(-)
MNNSKAIYNTTSTYTATQNQSNISMKMGMLPTTKYQTTDRNTSHVNTDQRPKLSKISDESWESTEKLINDKYAHAHAATPILKSPYINNNFHSQNSSSVSKITNNNNNNCDEELMMYLQLEPEPQQLPSTSYWMYNVIQFIKLLCLSKLLSQQNTSRNDIVIYSYSDTLSYIYNKFKNETSFKFKRDHHISHIKPESTAFFSAPLTVYKFYREFRFCKCGKVLV